MPWAVLAVPVATSAFPLLSASAESGDDAGFAEVASRSLRAVLLLSAGAAAVLAVSAAPVAVVLLQGAPGRGAGADELAAGVLGFAPGLVGYGLIVLLSRALYARGSGAAAAAGTVAGWLGVVVADVVLVAALPDVDRVLLLGVGNSIGLCLGAACLLLALVRSAGSGCVRGAARTALVAVAGGGLAVVVALAVPLDRAGPVPQAALVAVLLAGLAAVVHLLVVRLLDPAGVREVLGRGAVVRERR